MSHAKRFKNRKKVSIDHEIDKSSPVVHGHLVEQHLTKQADTKSLNEIDDIIESTYCFTLNTEIPEDESKELLECIEKNFNKQQFDNLIDACRGNVISALVIPFGLGRVIAEYDKNGGNVTTIDNANQGTYAQEVEKYDRDTYDKALNSLGKRFRGSKGAGDSFMKEQLHDGGKVVDAYTGKVEVATDTSPDHIESLSQYHKDGGYMQTDTQKADFATDAENLAVTSRSINQSLRNFDKHEWVEKESTTAEGTNVERFGIDEELFELAVERGKRTAGEHSPSALEKTEYFTKNTAKTGVEEGVRMGIQQALGIVLYEFFQGVFDETVDMYHKGLKETIQDDSFFNEIIFRYRKVANRVSSRWKHTFNVFQGGFISGFLSNLVTVIINSFITTSKRIVRVIREGFYSLLKALKILCSPPEGMDSARAAHEASKIIAAGIVIAGGIGLEQEIDTLIKLSVILEPLSDIITAVITGALTGIATTFTVYLIDKMDLLKVNSNERHEIIMNQLEGNLEELFAQGDDLVKNMAT